MTATPADASYAAEVARLLWPAPWEEPYVTAGRDRSGEHHRDAYLFPSRQHPRLLVPAEVRGSSTMLRRLGSDRGPLVRPMRGLLEHSVRSRAFALTRWPMLRVSTEDPTADSIECYLSGRLHTEVRVGVLLGTRRVNQKPVLQIFDQDGGLLGYAKVGHNDVTAALVRGEADSLATLTMMQPHSFQLPGLLHHGQWDGLEVLVLSALTTDPRQSVGRPARVAAMREVASLGGVTELPLAESRFWLRLRRAADLLADEWEGVRLSAAVQELGQAHAEHRLAFGAWHGDWGRWNMGVDDGALKIWDWERYDPEVPIGFDALHFAAQSVRPGERGERRQEQAFLRSVPTALTELGVEPAQHDIVLRLYLLEIAARYVEALTHGGTPVLRRRTSWVLSLLGQLTNPSPPAASKGRR